MSLVMTLDYKSWLKQAQDRLEELYEKRAAIDEEIAALQRGIEGFAPLVNESAPWRYEVVGMTESITQVFKESPNTCFRPTDIRDALVANGVALTQQNPMATIHQTISRLVARKVIESTESDGRTLYYFDASKQALGASRPKPTMPPPGSTAAEIMRQMSKNPKK